MRSSALLSIGFLLLILCPSLLNAQSIARADFNGDFHVYWNDYFEFAEAFGSSEIKYDFDENGRVDFHDFVSFARVYNQSVPIGAEFGLIFNYSVMARNQLNTLSGIFSKDMIVGPRPRFATTKMALSDDEVEEIRLKMQQIDFFNYPREFVTAQGDTVERVTPASSYKFSVARDSILTRVEWKDNIRNANDPKADRLRELADLIRAIIRSKEEYKRLPDPQGGYM